jgi:transcriptional regulator
MDDDIRENLKELGQHVHSIARQLESTKSNMDTIKAMSECLDGAKKTVDIYIKIQKDRWKD